MASSPPFFRRDLDHPGLHHVEKRQGRRHHDQAHRLVQDHRFQRAETKQRDQHRQAELGAAKADQPAQGADDPA
ncbi:hypothetical protein AP071_16865 [Rhodobacter capsulatus]|nr:hypothetical protein AP071_16865 [Rhodobacter capsulatus]